MERPKRSIEIPGLSHGKAPIPMGARVGNILYSSAISGREPGTLRLPPTVGEQAALAFAHMRALLKEAGADLSDVVRMSVAIRDDTVREAINAEWLTCFPDPHDRPARHIAVAGLAGDTLLQIEIVAVIEEKKP